MSEAGAIKQNPFSPAVIAATTLCPRIVAAAARAAHGHPASRIEKLHEAQQLARELVAQLDLVELQATGRNEL